jgi:hypothetical protein
MGDPRPNLGNELRRLYYDLGNYRRLSQKNDETLLNQTGGDATIPGQVTVETIQNVAGNDGISRTRLTWGQVAFNADNTACTDLAEYEIYRGASADTAQMIQVGRTDAGTREFTDIGLANGQTVYYAARAVDKWKNRGAFSTVQQIVTGDTQAPVTPTGFTAKGEFQQITLNWNNNTETDLAGYNLFESTDGANFTFLAFVTKAKTYVRASLGNGVKRYYKIQAEDKSGNTSALTAAINTTTTKPAGSDLQLGTWYAGEDLPTIKANWDYNSRGISGPGWRDMYIWEFMATARENKTRNHYTVHSSRSDHPGDVRVLKATTKDAFGNWIYAVVATHSNLPTAGISYDEVYDITPGQTVSFKIQLSAEEWYEGTNLIYSSAYIDWWEHSRQNTSSNYAV